MTTPTLEELAERHLFNTIEFYCDDQQNAFMEGLRALIKEFVSNNEVVWDCWDCGGTRNFNGTVYAAFDEVDFK